MTFAEELAIPKGEKNEHAIGFGSSFHRFHRYIKTPRSWRGKLIVSSFISGTIVGKERRGPPKRSFFFADRRVYHRSMPIIAKERTARSHSRPSSDSILTLAGRYGRLPGWIGGLGEFLSAMIKGSWMMIDGDLFSFILHNGRTKIVINSPIFLIFRYLYEI